MVPGEKITLPKLTYWDDGAQVEIQIDAGVYEVLTASAGGFVGNLVGKRR